MVEEGQQSDEEEKDESNESDENNKSNNNQYDRQSFKFNRPTNRFKNNVITPVVGGKKGGNFLNVKIA